MLNRKTGAGILRLVALLIAAFALLIRQEGRVSAARVFANDYVRT